MPLSIIATPGAETANSYVDAAEAVAIADARVGGAVFAALTGDDLARPLLTAAAMLDAVPWRYAKHSAGQAMQYPRTDTGTVDRWLKAAQVELAIHVHATAAAGGDALARDDSTAFRTVQVGEITLTRAPDSHTPGSETDYVSTFPPMVQALIAPHLLRTTGKLRPGVTTLVRG